MRHGTYSIVALDPATGELGAAVQSHWFSVGSLCTWAIAHSGDLEAGADAVRRAAAARPDWLVLLDRLSPDFAPAGPEVRRALGRGDGPS